MPPPMQPAKGDIQQGLEVPLLAGHFPNTTSPITLLRHIGSTNPGVQNTILGPDTFHSTSLREGCGLGPFCTVEDRASQKPTWGYSSISNRQPTSNKRRCLDEETFQAKAL